MPTQKPPSLVSRLFGVFSNPATVRNDIASILGLLGVIVSATGYTWHMPVIPDAIVGSGSFLLVVVVRFVHTLVDGKGLSADVAYIKGVLPDVKTAVGTVMPFMENEVPGLRSVVAKASTDSASAITVATQAAADAAKINGLQQPIAALQSLLKTSPATDVPTLAAQPVATAPPASTTPTA